MALPFTTEQFLALFAAYNDAVWPLQFVLAGAAIIAVAIAYRSGARYTRWPTVILASLWAWSGGVYHLVFFSRINPAAVVFGSLFLLQAALLLLAASRNTLSFRFRGSASEWVGAGLMSYALLVYPVLGAWLGHQYPAAPTFGAPCPLTIFTLGLLLWSMRRVPWYVFPIPLAWSVIGLSAAISLGMTEDLGLLVASLLVGGILARRFMRTLHPAR